MFRCQYNNNYDFVVPVIKAILAAAVEINTLQKGNNEKKIINPSGRSGSWRLLLDNNNHDGVSPLHFAMFQCSKYSFK